MNNKLNKFNNFTNSELLALYKCFLSLTDEWGRDEDVKKLGHEFSEEFNKRPRIECRICKFFKRDQVESTNNGFCNISRTRVPKDNMCCDFKYKEDNQNGDN